MGYSLLGERHILSGKKQLFQVDKALKETGYLYLWANPSNVDPFQFLKNLQLRLKEQFFQSWFINLELKQTLGNLELTNSLKIKFKLEKYL